MNKGFKSYFKSGLRSSGRVFKKSKGNYLKYIALLISTFLSKLTMIISPIFDLANVRAAQIAKEKKNIVLSASFSMSDAPKTFWNLLISKIIVGLIYLSGVIIIGLIAFGYTSIGWLIYGMDMDLVFLLVGFIPLGLVLIIYTILFYLSYSPMAFVAVKNSSLGASHILYNSSNSLRKEGKKTLLLLNIVYLLIDIVILGIIVAILVLIDTFVSESLASGIIGVVLVLGILVYFVLASRFHLARRISIINLFNDVVSTEPVDFELAHADNSTKKQTYQLEIKDKKNKKKNIKATNKEELLVSLFDDISLDVYEEEDQTTVESSIQEDEDDDEEQEVSTEVEEKE